MIDSTTFQIVIEVVNKRSKMTLHRKQKTRVVNKNKEQYDVYIGRGSKWGNPFIVNIHGSRALVIKKYRTYILGNEGLLKDLHELKGKRLGCFCKPLPCHGDVLVQLIEDGF